jgi:hypothetical protein
MAKVAGLEKSLKDKVKKDAEDLRFKFAKTDKQKKFLKENPNVRTASEMEKKIADMKSAEQTQSRFNLKKGGSAKGCKLAMKGKGRAYGKNS